MPCLPCCALQRSLDALEGLWAGGYFRAPERYRLAFREFGTTLGVQAGCMAGRELGRLKTPGSMACQSWRLVGLLFLLGRLSWTLWTLTLEMWGCSTACKAPRPALRACAGEPSGGAGLAAAGDPAAPALGAAPVHTRHR